MKLTELRLTNFSVVQQGSFSFSPQINVFLGRNGAGKSHVMKLIYSMLRAHRDVGQKPVPADVAPALKSKLVGVFRPDDGAVGRLISRGTGRKTASVALEATDASAKSSSLQCKFTVSNLGRVSVGTTSFPRMQPSVFLPSREALAMYEGFVQAYEGRELSFDETYRDLCVQLSGAQLRGPRLDAVRKLAKPLEEVLGGSIRLNGGRFYRSAPGGNLEAHLLSEGLRKIGVLTHLVLNGSLIKNGFLFWDEPEANLNPRLVTVIAKTLRRLGGFGIQIFVATHDFLLLNELAMADDYRGELKDGAPEVDVRFIGLNLAPDSSHVRVESVERLRELNNNDILEEFAAYYSRRSELIAKVNA